MSLQGAPELRRRLQATQNVGRDSGRVWANEATRLARTYAPRRTGRGAGSMHPTLNAKGAKVVGMYYMGAMMAKGTKPHDIPKGLTKRGKLRKGSSGKVLKFSKGGATFFRRKVHQRGDRPNDFAARAANQALARTSLRRALIDLWNKAA